MNSSPNIYTSTHPHKRFIIILSTLLSSILTSAYSQQQTFDKYSFKLPAGYTSKTGKTFIDFLKYNETKTSYAEITFYRTRPGTDDTKTEFIKDWNDLVKKSKGVEAPEQSIVEDENGWKSTFGSATVNVKEGKYIQTLITFTANNLVTSISVRATGNSFAKEIEDILGSVVLESPKKW